MADLGHKVDERTASADKPGLFTQLTSAVQKVTDKADAYIGSVRSFLPPPFYLRLRCYGWDAIEHPCARRDRMY